MINRTLLACAILLLACSRTPNSVETDGLTVEARRPFLILTNRTPAPTSLAVFERELAARIKWAPCLDLVVCPRIDPHQSASLPYNEILGFGPGKTEAVVYWWHLIPGGFGGVTLDSIRAVAVRL